MSQAEQVYIVGSGITSLGKQPDRSVRQLSAIALGKALADAGLTDPTAIEAAWFSNTRQALLEGQNGIRARWLCVPAALLASP